MAKTANAVSGRRGKLEIVISQAIADALPGIFATQATDETVDISSVVKSISGGGITRAVNKEYVIGDDNPISDYDQRVERGDMTVNFLYTNGLEEFGTDDWDLYTALKAIAEYTAEDLSIQLIWSPAGGAIGDEEFSTSATETFITGLPDPVGGVDTNGKIQIALTVNSPTFVRAVVA